MMLHNELVKAYKKKKEREAMKPDFAKYKAVIRLTLEKPFIDYIWESDDFNSPFPRLLIPGTQSQYVSPDEEEDATIHRTTRSGIKFGEIYTRQIGATEYETEPREYPYWASDIIALSRLAAHFQDPYHGERFNSRITLPKEEKRIYPFLFRIDGRLEDGWEWRAYICLGCFRYFDEEDKIEGKFPYFDCKKFVAECERNYNKEEE